MIDFLQNFSSFSKEDRKNIKLFSTRFSNESIEKETKRVFFRYITIVSDDKHIFSQHVNLRDSIVKRRSFSEFLQYNVTRVDFFNTNGFVDDPFAGVTQEINRILHKKENNDNYDELEVSKETMKLEMKKVLSLPRNMATHPAER